MNRLKAWLIRKDLSETQKELEAAKKRSYFWNRRVRNLERAERAIVSELRNARRK